MEITHHSHRQPKKHSLDGRIRHKHKQQHVYTRTVTYDYQKIHPLKFSLVFHLFLLQVTDDTNFHLGTFQRPRHQNNQTDGQIISTKKEFEYLIHAGGWILLRKTDAFCLSSDG